MIGRFSMLDIATQQEERQSRKGECWKSLVKSLLKRQRLVLAPSPFRSNRSLKIGREMNTVYYCVPVIKFSSEILDLTCESCFPGDISQLIFPSKHQHHTRRTLFELPGVLRAVPQSSMPFRVLHDTQTGCICRYFFYIFGGSHVAIPHSRLGRSCLTRVES